MSDAYNHKIGISASSVFANANINPEKSPEYPILKLFNMGKMLGVHHVEFNPTLVTPSNWLGEINKAGKLYEDINATIHGFWPSFIKCGNHKGYGFKLHPGLGFTKYNRHILSQTANALNALENAGFNVPVIGYHSTSTGVLGYSKKNAIAFYKNASEIFPNSKILVETMPFEYMWPVTISDYCELFYEVPNIEILLDFQHIWNMSSNMDDQEFDNYVSWAFSTNRVGQIHINGISTIPSLQHLSIKRNDEAYKALRRYSTEIANQEPIITLEIKPLLPYKQTEVQQYLQENINIVLEALC